ncbi:translocation/assembly module TamB domain-containing protein [Burkholderia sp. FERM BP-3421]|uniref:translocation/assembly module TamB domain-containing protein n=1 Tax=Burkholderia sp. FERM BP-3421 TaxID=1494466 RepID=UPI002360E0E9|nr:translocation/assembly module TamB domain-containing protein [Burkholderia sp. FERM BP-3421]WDD94945.1 translocation/assembly module TamB domain-containing protein [Burkholderia sp. FERM BP-3421]
MTQDVSAPPPAAAAPGAEPPAPRRRRPLRALARTLGVLALLAALLAGALVAAVATERGTRIAWQAAVKLLGGRLAGTLEGGSLAHGVRLSGFAWTSPDGAGTEVRIDRVSGRWALTRAPLRLTIDTLRAGAIDVRIPPSPPSPTTLPEDLRLPLQLTVRDLRFDTLSIHEGGSTTELAGLVFSGRSDGRHHDATLERLDTPFGALSARARLDGVRPFAIAGDAAYTGKFADEPVNAQARVSGSLAALVAELDASGMKLNGRAQVEAAPFSDVPLTRATLAFDHVNPQAFAPGAPRADLAVRAQLAPAPADPRHPGAFVVTGPVSIVNAKPGPLGDNLLPVLDARADARLDAHAQRIDGLALRLLRGGSVTGGGALAGGRGRFDLKVADLDLNAFVAALRPMKLGGPVGVTLAEGGQTIAFDLSDPKLALGAKAKVALEPRQIAISEARVTAGKGRVDLAGTLKHDARSSYDLKATLTDFDPLALTAAGTRPGAGGPRAGTARVNGTLAASGALEPGFTARAQFKLGDSVYDRLPLTGQGTLQMAGARILPSNVNLSIAGNQVDLQGSFGAAGDRLRFAVDAPQLDRLGFGLAGLLQANGDLTGSFAHPNVSAAFKASGVAFGENRIGSAQGQAEIRDGAHGALVFNAQAADLALGAVRLRSASANLNGTRAKHTFEAAALGAADGRVINLSVAAAGGLVETREGPRWDGTVTRLANRGTPSVSLDAPLTVSAGAGRVLLGAARLGIEGAQLDLKSFALDHGKLRSAGAISNLSVARALTIREELTGARTPLRTDLVLDGDWDFALADTASGYLQIKRRSGDVTLESGRGVASLGITDITARAAFGAGNRLNATVRAQANRIGTLDASLAVPFTLRDGVLAPAADAPLSGRIDVDVPALKTTGGLFGPSYLLDGHAALKLTLGGTPAKPSLSGMLTGDGLSATMVDQGVQLKDGVVRVKLTENLVEFQQVEFHGGQGTLRMLGRVRLDGNEPDLAASIVADKLELFAAPDRKLSLSGKATVENDGARGGVAINGKFTVDRALFDLPEESAPHLSDDVVIVRPDGTVRGETRTGTAIAKPAPAADKPAPSLAPRANVDIDLGSDFRFKGHGADLGLRGTITVMSAPGVPLRAVGNVRVTEGSTYTSFGRKLAIENGFFTFNGPVSNPGINILAMRRNQEVEAGVQVTGTVQAPVAKLVSEPNVADNEKLSWLLFGHGTDQGNNLGQQNTMTTALALLGSATGKRVAQTFGLDEFSIGRSEVGLTDPQVVMVSKAINERFVLGYEQGLQSASNAFKATLNLTRFWSVSAYTGTFQGVDLNYTRRFDRWWW